ncbi:MAG: hypothetical protein M3R23_07005 [Actinomycetota bacterium]|nr:hypothetical protein [Actinomycetota bacterium]
MLDAPAYLLGFASLVASLWALGLGAARVRSRLLSGWSGLPACLADAVIALALLIWIAELIGTVGMLERAPLVAACVAVGLGLRLAVRPPPPGDGHPPPAPPYGSWGRSVATAIAAILIVHWSIGTIAALGTGMTSYDSAWYHMPFAAQFAQTGSSVGFAYVSPRYLAWFYPQNSELLHGVGMVFLHRDLLSPMLNLLWLGGCLVAAWCIGRPYAKGAWTVAAVAVILDAGVMADQAGEARNDTLGLFFLLAAVAMLVNGAAADKERRPGLGPLAIAGVCVGLAAGTKLSFLAPAAALLIGLPAIAAAGHRRRASLAFGLPLLAGCAFWYVRNVVVASNPLPWFRALGPLRLDGPEQGLGGRQQFSVLHYVGDGRVWREWFEPSLGHRLGELWPLLLLAAVIAIVVCLARAESHLKLVACAATAGVVAYLLDGTSAEGAPGMPDGFASSLRHLMPGLCMALVLLPLAPGMRSRRARAGLGVLLAVFLIAADLSGEHWRPVYVLVAVVAAAVAVCVPLLRRTDMPRLVARISPAAAAVAAATVVLLLVGGWFLQRSYLSHRYDGKDFRSAGLNAAFEWANHQHEQRIATTVPVQYPLVGTDLSNRVSFVGRRRADAGFTQIGRCRPWRAALAAGGYRFVVTAGGLEPWERGMSHCLAKDPLARPVVRENQIVVFRLERRAARVRGHSPELGRSEVRRRRVERQRSSRS